MGLFLSVQEGIPFGFIIANIFFLLLLQGIIFLFFGGGGLVSVGGMFNLDL